MLSKKSNSFYGMLRNTYSGVECTQIETGQNALTLSHLYSVSQQLPLLRMLLVRETDKSLVLAYGIPRSWLEQGNKVFLQNGPFRAVSFEMISGIDEGEVAVNIDRLKVGLAPCFALLWQGRLLRSM